MIDQKVYAHDSKNGKRIRVASPIEKEVWENQVVRHPSFRNGIMVGEFLIDQEGVENDGILDQGVSD